MSDRVAAQTQQTADVGRRLEMHAHEMTSRMTFASAKKGALRSVQRAAAKAPRSWRSSTVMVFLSPCTWPALHRMSHTSSPRPSTPDRRCRRTETARGACGPARRRGRPRVQGRPAPRDEPDASTGRRGQWAARLQIREHVFPRTRGLCIFIERSQPFPDDALDLRRHGHVIVAGVRRGVGAGRLNGL